MPLEVIRSAIEDHPKPAAKQPQRLRAGVDALVRAQFVGSRTGCRGERFLRAGLARQRCACQGSQHGQGYIVDGTVIIGEPCYGFFLGAALLPRELGQRRERVPDRGIR